MDVLAGLTLTEATGTGLTVMLAVPLLPPLVAVIVVDPAATAVTSPVPFTLATAALPVLHATLLPLRAFPAESLGVAVNCAVWPTCRVSRDGVTVTDATGTRLTVTAAEPDFPSLVAVIVADPAATAVTRPVPFTDATAALLVFHVTLRPVSVLPAESLVVAVS